MNAIQKEICSNPAHQIIFKVGIVDKIVEDFLKNRLKTAIGYAFRKEYDHKTFRTGGYIWFAPKAWVKNYRHPIHLIKEFPLYNHPTQFKHLVLHELAHIFGVPLNDQWGSPLSKDIFTRIGQAQIFWSDSSDLYLKPSIENEKRKLAPLSTRISQGGSDSAIIPTDLGHRELNDDAPFVHFLSSLGIKNPVQSFKKLYYQYSYRGDNGYSTENSRLFIEIKNGEKYELRPEKILEHYEPMITWNIHQEIQFYSPRYLGYDSYKMATILSTGAERGKYKYIFKAGNDRYLVIITFSESPTADFYPLSNKYTLPPDYPFED